MMACAACASVSPDMSAVSDGAAAQFSLPTIHCAGCIGTIERALAGVNGVREARVNLSLKRLSVTGPIQPSDVLRTIKGLGYEIFLLDAAVLDKATDRKGRDLLLRLAVAGFAMMNVMLLSVAVWSGASGATRDLFHLISAGIAVPVVAYSAQPFFQSAFAALKGRRLNMDVPISLAILLATGMSVFESLQGGRHAYFDAALSLTFFLLIGRYLDHRTRSAARSAAKELTALEVHQCKRIRGERVETVPTSAVAIGDILLIESGMRVPVDGTLMSENALMDRAFLTGESEAVDVVQGAALQAGEINLGAPVELRATAVGEDTTLRRVAAFVETAENSRNSYTALADRAAQIYAPAVHLLAFVAFAAWWLGSGDVRLALNIAIAVLIITCPCALGLAVPAVTTAAISRLFSKGFLVKHATAIERLADVDHIVFDKTGTLSSPAVDIPETLSPRARSICLSLAQHSNHALSAALAERLAGVPPVALDSIEEHAGQGISARLDGQVVRLGRGAWIGADFRGFGLRIGESAPIELPFHEVLKPGAQEALSDLDLPSEIVTGDHAASARRFADLAGLPVLADARPEDKSRRLDALAKEGRKVLMVGDGLNDTMALARAHASLAPASALDVSRSVSDVVLLKESLQDLPLLIRVARQTQRLSKQNFAIAALYNLIAIPIALAGFATPLRPRWRCPRRRSRYC
ncbi:heavy metal translocating P-type ATPase [Sulfitobacter aestuariivivens]|uniref:heavy metal translocating P-type ATPase n=1 Tax=Sulfitobacter aestuariivivens TaxID=2766981 RepID=UPI0036195127